MSDPVQAPSHYVAGEFECIDVMRAVFTADEFRAYCLCTAFAYLWRHGRKDGEPIERDVAKAARYLRWARAVTVPEQSGVTPQAMADAVATRDAAIREKDRWEQLAVKLENARQKAQADLEEQKSAAREYRVGMVNADKLATKRLWHGRNVEEQRDKAIRERDQAFKERDEAIKERDKWYEAYNNHSASIVRLMAKIDDLTAKGSTT